MGTIPAGHPTKQELDSVVGDLMADLKNKKNLRMERTFVLGQKYYKNYSIIIRVVRPTLFIMYENFLITLILIIWTIIVKKYEWPYGIDARVFANGLRENFTNITEIPP